MFSTVLRFLSEAPKANVSDATIFKKVEKKSEFLLGIHVIIYRLLSNIYDQLRKLGQKSSIAAFPLNISGKLSFFDVYWNLSYTFTRDRLINIFALFTKKL